MCTFTYIKININVWNVLLFNTNQKNAHTVHMFIFCRCCYCFFPLCLLYEIGKWRKQTSSYKNIGQWKSWSKTKIHFHINFSSCYCMFPLFSYCFSFFLHFSICSFVLWLTIICVRLFVTRRLRCHHAFHFLSHSVVANTLPRIVTASRVEVLPHWCHVHIRVVNVNKGICREINEIINLELKNSFKRIWRAFF